MYKIINITDLNGNVNFDRLRKIEEIYSLYGTFERNNSYIGMKCFQFNFNGTTKCLSSSRIKTIEYNNDLIIITTRNSIYTFKEQR